MKVYVVLYHSEWESYTPSSDVIGVFDTKEKAQKAMREEIDVALKNSWTVDEEDTEREETDDKISLYDTLGNIDYVSVEVLEKEIE